MGKSADDYRTTDREQAALLGALDAGKALPRDWLALPPGRALRRLRKRLRLGQWEIAAAVGLRQSAVSKIERGDDARWSTLSALFEAMGCRLAVVPVTERSLDGLWALGQLKRREREERGRAALERMIQQLEQADDAAAREPDSC